MNLFEGAERAKRSYAETEPDPVMPEPAPVPAAEPPPAPAQVAVAPPPVQPLAPEPVPAEPVVAPVPVSLDLEAMSQDLAGGWIKAGGAGTHASHARARHGLRGAIARVGFPVKPGRRELAEIARADELARAEANVRQATFLRSMTILMAQRKGGVGKTSAAISLGGVLAHIRGGGVVIPEVSDDPGMVALRSEGHPQRGMGELVRDVHTVTSAGMLAGYTAPQTSHAAVIGSPTPRPILTGEDVTNVHTLLARYFSIQLLDSGNVYASEAFQAALRAADTLVIPVADAGDSIQDALALVQFLRTDPVGASLVDGATVLRLRYVKAAPETVTRIDEVLSQLGVARIVDIPFDAHIDERAEITLANLAPATREALLIAASGVIDTLNAVHAKEHHHA